MTNSRAALRTPHAPARTSAAPSPVRGRGMPAVLLVATVVGVIWLGSMIYTIADWAAGL
ncbi:morphogenic membrane protein MmpA [Streptomyces sp. NPDC050509]|uniref:morphogenic membrane protein MmpA n=1 Tax=Streptomyces sp. NPDC050509 TaxID=3365620 RepID=UPI0037A8F353